jgi:hypothetical protein
MILIKTINDLDQKLSTKIKIQMLREIIFLIFSIDYNILKLIMYLLIQNDARQLCHLANSKPTDVYHLLWP